MKLTEIPEAVEADAHLCGFTDWLGEVLTKAGGIVTDVGYSFVDGSADIAVAAPDGTRLNLKIARLGK